MQQKLLPCNATSAQSPSSLGALNVYFLNRDGGSQLKRALDHHLVPAIGMTSPVTRIPPGNLQTTKAHRLNWDASIMLFIKPIKTQSKKKSRKKDLRLVGTFKMGYILNGWVEGPNDPRTLRYAMFICPVSLSHQPSLLMHGSEDQS